MRVLRAVGSLFYDGYWGVTPLGFVVGFLLLIGVIFGVGVTIDYHVSRHSCKRNAEQMALAYDYGLWTGCKVDVPGVGWRDIDSVRVNYTPEETE